MPNARINRVKSPALIVFGEAIRHRRKALGYSQEAFGDACGIDRSYMGGIERGEHNLALINILKIIDALGVQPSDFFVDLDKPAKAQLKTKKSP
jgi:transcriptional regulator with XRE-family HTH domain